MAAAAMSPGSACSAGVLPVVKSTPLTEVATTWTPPPADAWAANDRAFAPIVRIADVWLILSPPASSQQRKLSPHRTREVYSDVFDVRLRDTEIGGGQQTQVGQNVSITNTIESLLPL